MSGPVGRRKAVVVGDGAVPDRQLLDRAWPRWADGVGLTVAADGGAVKAEALGFRVDVLTGDVDSLPPAGVDRLRSAGSSVELRPAAKDESDLELAVCAAADRGAHEIIVLGALGGTRLDHTIANLALLAHPALAHRSVALLDAAVRVRLLRGPAPHGVPVRLALPGAIGGLVSLQPLGADVEGVTTSGLRYPLRDEPLRLGPARGLSNVRVAAGAAVSLRRGLLLVIESAPAAGETGGGP